MTKKKPGPAKADAFAHAARTEMDRPAPRRRDRRYCGAPRIPQAHQTPQAPFTGIVFSGFWASGVFGSVTVSTPLLNVASIFSGSTPSGIWK